LIKRSSKQFIDKLITQNSDWQVLDIGCGFTAHEKANVVCDIQDLSNFYKDKKFVKLNDKKLPFRDKEFDFVIASHVIEHVEDVTFFIKELERVALKGYIELPTPLEDNLVFENKNDHIWHVEFDDIENKLLIKKRIQYFEPLITVSTAKKLSKYFRQSLLLELFWQNSIEFELIENDSFRFEKISRLTLIRKFFSKILRNIKR
jgi:ubiquinone/menaquinone biosynthesis C-methylase UbiE